MKTGYIAKFNGVVVTDQEQFNDFVTGDGSKWEESMPFNGQVFNCTLTDAPYPSWVFNKIYCMWQPPVAAPLEGNYNWDEPTQSWVPA